MLLFKHRGKPRRIIKAFKAKTIDDGSIENMCFTVSLPLHLHLKNQGYHTTIIPGTLNSRPHYWLKYGINLIIDAAGNQIQFNHRKPFPDILIGRKIKGYEEQPRKNIDDEIDNWVSTFINSLTEIRQNNYLGYFDPDAIAIRPSIEKVPEYIRFVIRAGIVLQRDMKPQNTQNYLDVVFLVCEVYTVERITALFNNNLPDGWGNLISNFNGWRIANNIRND